MWSFRSQNKLHLLREIFPEHLSYISRHPQFIFFIAFSTLINFYVFVYMLIFFLPSLEYKFLEGKDLTLFTTIYSSPKLYLAHRKHLIISVHWLGSIDRLIFLLGDLSGGFATVVHFFPWYFLSDFWVAWILYIYLDIQMYMSLIHFRLILPKIWAKGPISFCHERMSSFLSTCWRDSSSSTYSLVGDHVTIDIILGSYSIPLFYVFVLMTIVLKLFLWISWRNVL